MTSNITKMNNYLKICILYLKDISNTRSWMVNKYN